MNQRTFRPKRPTSLSLENICCPDFGPTDFRKNEKNELILRHSKSVSADLRLKNFTPRKMEYIVYIFFIFFNNPKIDRRCKGVGMLVPFHQQPKFNQQNFKISELYPIRSLAFSPVHGRPHPVSVSMHASALSAAAEISESVSSTN